MSSIQERLQLKRVPLDTWNIREQLCLASAVVRSGDQNWMSVSRALKTVGEPNRPPDWYSQKSCAAQYGALLEHVETPKRKKRSSEGAVETPQESILKRLTQERIVEIQKNVAEMNQQYELLKTEITEVRNPATSEDRLQELWRGIEAAKRARERETARRAAWLREREERRARAERTWRPPQASSPTTPSPAPPSSPLLTSLLKSSPVVTTPQHIPHPATVVETVSPSAGAPTLSMLLEKSGGSPHENKHAAIEHIKSQLVQIEQQLKANTGPPQPVPLTPTPAVDIDDIEIKAEDVYAFRDIDIHIPPVTALHKGQARTEKPVFKKDEASVSTAPEHEPMEEDEIKLEPAEETVENLVPAAVESNEPPREPTPVREVTPEAEVKISFPEVKFPTPEIKVIQPEEHKQVKEDIKEPEPESPTPEVVEDKIEEKAVEQPAVVPVEEEIVQPAIKSEPVVEPEPIDEVIPEPVVEAAPQDIPLPPDPKPEATADGPENVADIPVPELETAQVQEDPAAVPPQEEVEESISEIEKELAKDIIEVTKLEEKYVQQGEDAEDSIPLKEMLREDIIPPLIPESEMKEEKLEIEDTHTETDDDTPMELSREEEKDGKKKRDYSRKKKSDSRTCSGSESAAEASAPESPGGDPDRQRRLWRKSVMLVYSRLCAHKYASLFLRPISDEEAPGYSVVVKRPMDLTTIRRNIDSGLIRTTAEFQRDVLLMLSNALMYNSSEHSVYTMAKEMHEEAMSQLGMLLAAQAHAGLCEAPPRRKRRAPDHPRPSRH